MLFYIVIFILANIFGITTSDTYSTGNADDLVSFIDETMHNIQFSILSLQDAELALKDTLNMYTWDPKPPLSNIHKSFFNLERYSGVEIATINKKGYYGTFSFSEKEEITTHQKMIFMTLTSGSNITISRNSSIHLEKSTMNNIKITPTPNNPNITKHRNPDSSITLEVIRDSASICIEDQNTKITFNNNSVIHYVGKLLLKEMEADIEAGTRIYFPSRTDITLQSDIFFTIVNSNPIYLNNISNSVAQISANNQLSYINEYNMIRWSFKTPTFMNITVEPSTVVIFHNETKLNTSMNARFLLKSINSKCHVERRYIAEAILNQYVKTLVIEDKYDDRKWCNSVKSNNYLAKNDINTSPYSQILKIKCQSITSDASIISLCISSYILMLLMII